jgi:hypothetical protein
VIDETQSTAPLDTLSPFRLPGVGLLSGVVQPRLRHAPMRHRLFNLAATVLLAPFFAAFAYHGVRLIVAMFTPFERSQWFVAGMALSLFASLVFLQGNIGFVQKLLHELEHAVLAFLFSGQPPVQMTIRTRGDSEVVTANAGGCLRALAPYYLPLLTIPFLLLKALLALVLSLLDTPFPATVSAALDFLIGATLIFHYLTSLREFSLAQPDIQKTGILPSLVAVLFINLSFFVLSLVVVTGSYAAFLDYLKTASQTMFALYADAYEFLVNRGIPALAGLLGEIRERLR